MHVSKYIIISNRRLVVIGLFFQQSTCGLLAEEEETQDEKEGLLHLQYLPQKLHYTVLECIVLSHKKAAAGWAWHIYLY